jgi:hypothetical protein
MGISKKEGRESLGIFAISIEERVAVPGIIFRLDIF